MTMIDWTKQHEFEECRGYGTVGSTCSSDEHCMCGQARFSSIHLVADLPDAEDCGEAL